MKFTLTFLGFLAINIGALFLGTLLMNDGPTSSWYFDLEKAPWTPAGWVFGAAWTCVMVFFSVFISYLHQNRILFWANSALIDRIRFKISCLRQNQVQY